MDEEQEKQVLIDNRKKKLIEDMEIIKIKEKIQRLQDDNDKLKEDNENLQLQYEQDNKEWLESVDKEKLFIRNLTNDNKEIEQKIKEQEKFKLELDDWYNQELEKIDQKGEAELKKLKKRILKLKMEKDERIQFKKTRKTREQENEKLSEEIQYLKDLKAQQIKELNDEMALEHQMLNNNMEVEIQNTKSELLGLSKENMDPILRALVLQNNQLAIEIQYQQECEKTITQSNKKLQIEIKQMRSDLNVHQMVEKELSEKTTNQKQLYKEMNEISQHQTDLSTQLMTDIDNSRQVNQSLFSQPSFMQNSQDQSMFKFKKLKNSNNSNHNLLNNNKSLSKLQSNQRFLSDYSEDLAMIKENSKNIQNALYKDQQHLSSVQSKIYSFLKKFNNKNTKFIKDFRELKSYNLKSQKKLYHKQDLSDNALILIDEYFQHLYNQYKEIIQENQDEDEDNSLYFNLNNVMKKEYKDWNLYEKLSLISLLKQQLSPNKQDILENEQEEPPEIIDIKFVDLVKDNLLQDKKFRLSKNATARKHMRSTPDIFKIHKNDSEYNIHFNKKNKFLTDSIQKDIQDAQYQRLMKRMPSSQKMNTNQRYQKNTIANKSIEYDIKSGGDFSIINGLNTNNNRLNSISSVEQNSIIKKNINTSIISTDSAAKLLRSNNQNSISILNQEQQQQQQQHIEIQQPKISDQLHDFKYLESELFDINDHINQVKQEMKDHLQDWKEILDEEFPYDEKHENLYLQINTYLENYGLEQIKLKQQQNMNRSKNINNNNNLSSSNNNNNNNNTSKYRQYLMEKQYKQQGIVNLQNRQEQEIQQQQSSQQQEEQDNELIKILN